MRLTILAVALTISAMAASPAFCASSCSRECSADYRADICACQEIGAEDSGGNSKACDQEASDDYGTCLNDCSDPLSLNLR